MGPNYRGSRVQHGPLVWQLDHALGGRGFRGSANLAELLSGLLPGHAVVWSVHGSDKLEIY